MHAVARREGAQQPRAARVGAQHVDGSRRVAHSATLPSGHVPAPARPVALAGARGRVLRCGGRSGGRDPLDLAARRRLASRRRVHRHAGHEPHEHRAQAEGHRSPDGRRLRVAGLRLYEGAHALPAAQGAAAAPVREGVAGLREPADRVPARAVQALALHGEEQRRPLQDQPPDRQGALEGEARLSGRLVAGVRGRQRVRGRPRARQGDQGRARDGARCQERPRALVAQAALARGVLAAGGQRPPVLRHRGRHGLRAAGPRRRAALALQGRRRGQGRARARPGAPVLRRLRRPRPRHPPARRLADLADVERRHAPSA